MKKPLTPEQKEAYNKRKRDYYNVNKERILEQHKTYKAKNKELINAKNKSYRDNNQEKIHKSRSIYNEKNKEKISKRAKEYRDNNQELIKQYFENNKEILSEKRKIYKEKNKEKIKNWFKEYYTINKEILRENRLKYYKDNKERIRRVSNENAHNRMKNDEKFNLKETIRKSILKSLTKNGYTKKSRTYEILGCTYNEFKIHIESQFEDWMNWDNKGNPIDGILEPNKTWDIDHIIPLSSAKTEEDIIKLNHFTNLQPLCSYVNRKIKRG